MYPHRWRPPLAIFATTFWIGATGCNTVHDQTGNPALRGWYRDNAMGQTATANSTIEARRFVKGDADGDGDQTRLRRADLDDVITRNYGRRANRADARAIVGLTRRYYASAAAGDGSTVCSLLDPGLRRGTHVAEIAERLYPPAVTAPPLAGRSCDYIMSMLFRERHPQLAQDDAGFKVSSVRVKGHDGLALLAFTTRPEREMPFRREGVTWKIDSLFDQEIP